MAFGIHQTQSNETTEITEGTVTDIDGNSYKTVIIGEQEWMAENLNVSHFRNGDEIPQARTEEEWKKAGIMKQPVWCYYEFDSTNNKKYGKLYNWYVVSDARGVSPDNFEVPTIDQLHSLLSILYNQDTSWLNVRKFIGNFAGVKKGFHSGLDLETYFWSISKYDDTELSWSYFLELPVTGETVLNEFPDGSWSRFPIIKETGMKDEGTVATPRVNGYSVRCIKKIKN